jgi:hypothetical protein
MYSVPNTRQTLEATTVPSTGRTRYTMYVHSPADPQPGQPALYGLFTEREAAVKAAAQWERALNRTPGSDRTVTVVPVHPHNAGVRIQHWGR